MHACVRFFWGWVGHKYLETPTTTLLKPSGLSHREQIFFGVLVLEILVYRQRVGRWAHGQWVSIKKHTRKLLSIYAFSSHAIAVSKVTTLEHKVGNDAMESRTLVVQSLATFAHALFAGAEC